ncbi:tetratricopeptide repeat protein [Salinarimonas sp.]|uniref:tetratricopeptide repeat protein n=1 Tax=Salinarimonas sp. TaxID=2766526 RepID=UPI0032D9ACF6
MTDDFAPTALLASAFGGVGGNVATAGLAKLRERLFPAQPDPDALELARAVRRAQLRALLTTVDAFAALPHDTQPRHLVEALRLFARTALDTPSDAAPAVEPRVRALVAGQETADLRAVSETLTLDEAAAQAPDAPGFDAFTAFFRAGDTRFPGWWPHFRTAMADEIAGNAALRIVLEQQAVLEVLGRQEDLATALAELRGAVDGLPDEIERRVARLLALRREAAIDPGTANVTLPQVVERLKTLPTGLLLARYGIVPYLDRNDTRGRLLDWARDPEKPYPRGRLYVAGGGFGKTRLAIEAIAALTPGWKASFVGNAMKGADDESLRGLLDLPEGKEGVLLVVDYAESQLGRLAELTRFAAGMSHRIRILALARSAEGWWDGFTDSEAAATIFDRAPHAEVATPLTPEERARLHADARRAFAAAFAWLDVPHPPPSDDGPAALDADRPLVVAMSAYLAALGVSAEGGDVIAAMAAQERRHWKRAVAKPGEDPDAIVHNDPRVVSMHRLMAQVTLVQGATLDGARTLMDADPYRVRLAPGSSEETLAAAQRLYGFALPLVGPDGPTTQDGLRQIEPDLIGEQLCVMNKMMTQLAEGVEPTWKELVAATLVTAEQDLFFGDVGALLTVLSRAQAPIHGKKARDSASQIVKALETTLPLLNAEEIRRIDAQIPEQNIHLARLSVHVNARVLETAVDEADLARAAGNYAVSLAEVGDMHAALEHARRAVNNFDKLAATEPILYHGDLATSLTICANCLIQVGETNAALKHTRRAIDILETLAAAEPDRFLAGLATTLSNFVGCLCTFGDGPSSLAPARRAVEIYERLIAAEPSRFLPDLATGLNNYAIALGFAGEVRAALEPARRAVDIREKLATDDPARFLPHLARAYGSLGTVLAAAGNHVAGAEAFAKGLAAVRGPAEQLPEAFGELQRGLAGHYLRAAIGGGIQATDIRASLTALGIDPSTLSVDEDPTHASLW